MCSGSKEGSYLRLIDFWYLSIQGSRVIQKKTKIVWPDLDQGNASPDSRTRQGREGYLAHEKLHTPVGQL